jgi:hypothetical protein
MTLNYKVTTAQRNVLVRALLAYPERGRARLCPSFVEVGSVPPVPNNGIVIRGLPETATPATATHRAEIRFLSSTDAVFDEYARDAAKALHDIRQSLRRVQRFHQKRSARH